MWPATFLLPDRTLTIRFYNLQDTPAQIRSSSKKIAAVSGRKDSLDLTRSARSIAHASGSKAISSALSSTPTNTSSSDDHSAPVKFDDAADSIKVDQAQDTEVLVAQHRASTGLTPKSVSSANFSSLKAARSVREEEVDEESAAASPSPVRLFSPSFLFDVRPSQLADDDEIYDAPQVERKAFTPVRQIAPKPTTSLSARKALQSIAAAVPIPQTPAVCSTYLLQRDSIA